MSLKLAVTVSPGAMEVVNVLEAPLPPATAAVHPAGTETLNFTPTSGAPVVLRATKEPDASADVPWILLGVHSARLDAGTRDVEVDEALGLNCAWYADILLTLTED